MYSDWVIIAAGVLAAINGSLLGAYLLLQKNALVSDAISHAVLPGIVVAFIISGTKASGVLLLGAAASGIILTQLIFWLTRHAKMQQDAALGLGYTFMFALGLLLLSVYLRDVDIDAECVLFGEIAYVSIDTTQLGSTRVPRAFLLLGPTLIGTLAALILGRKPLFLSTFNPDYSTAIGVNVGLWQNLLLILTSIFTVMSFELVGAILVVGFMIVPAATALLFAKNLKQMLLLGCLFGCVAVIMGYYIATALNVSITGSMVSCSGILFLASIGIRKKGFSKRYGRSEVLLRHQHQKQKSQV